MSLSLYLYDPLCMTLLQCVCPEELKNRIIHGDALEVLGRLPDGSIDLVLTDPPYFRIAAEKWDRQWASLPEFQAWVERVAVELRRVLAPHGALYWFCDDKHGAYCQTVLDKYFRLLNHLVWEKPSLPCFKSEASGLRSYSISTERILFYEQAGASGLSATGLQQIHSAPDCFRPLKDYFRRERSAMMAARGWTKLSEFNAWCASVTGYRSIYRHWFDDSQWELPTAANYRALQSGGFFRREYEELRREYEELRREYEELRRPWNNAVGAREVLRFPGAPPPRIHPTQKPVSLLRYLLERSTRPGFTVLDPFAGSGSTAVACQQLGLSFICVEREAGFCEAAGKFLNRQSQNQKSNEKSPEQDPGSTVRRYGGGLPSIYGRRPTDCS